MSVRNARQILYIIPKKHQFSLYCRNDAGSFSFIVKYLRSGDEINTSERLYTAMAPEDAFPGDRPGTNRTVKPKQHTGKQVKKRPPPKKTGPSVTVTKPECILIDGQGSCPEWEELLVQYPMIDSVQREDFPEHGVSFAYLAHFYRTGNTAEEGSRAQTEFEDFFKTIGYTYDYSGNYESRWFEGIGVHTR